MFTKTISITEDAYDRLRSLKETERMSFSEVILKYYPKRRGLSETLAEIARGEGKRIGDFDGVIAAIALSRDQEMVTRDGHFSEVPGLVMMGW